MGSATGITYVDRTWNPVSGCSHVSEGCRHCWAEVMTHRLAGRFPERYGGLTNARGGWTGEVRCHADRLEQPLQWRKPMRVFVCSQADLFHDEVPTEFIERMWSVMAEASQHQFLVLTKRPERLHRWSRWHRQHGSWNMLANVWLGVSVENQETANERIPLLLQVPAAVHWVSAEPLLGPIRLGKVLYTDDMFEYHAEVPGGAYELVGQSPLDWLVVGGESGPHHRPCQVEWIESIVNQCRAAGVPVWVKQDSGPTPGKQGRIPDDLWAIKEIPR